MLDMKQQVVNLVRQIDDLNGEIENHWNMIRKSISDGQVDGAISLLNAYLRLKTKLTVTESTLAGTLGGYFSDK